MYYGKRQLLFTALAAIFLGCAQHFVFDWWPNALTALFAPVSESLWEHSKLVFWPYLFGAFWLNRDRPHGMAPWLLTLPVLIAGMLALGFIYNVWLGGEAGWVNIAIYVLVMAVGFWLPTRFLRPVAAPARYAAIVITALLAAALMVFTLYPPDMILFRDLSTARAWFSMPC